MRDFDGARDSARKIIENVERVMVGKSDAVELGVIALMCGGHALIEDVPGVGKTMLVRSVAKSVGCGFKRIQFTPDLLPTDVTGVSIYNQQTGAFEFRAGPIISQLVLADEVNRATPKTQSAMLEAMDERQVTVEGVTHAMPSPFMVMATQNPVEYEGTFPLPEAQLDRFLLIIRLGYPTVDEELEIVERQQLAHPIETLEAVASAEEVVGLQRTLREVYVDDLVKRYIVSLVDATRSREDVALGASPRASLALFRGAQAVALIGGRDYVMPDDVKRLAVPMLSHRMIMSAAARMRGTTSAETVETILDETAVPGGQARSTGGR